MNNLSAIPIRQGDSHDIPIYALPEHQVIRNLLPDIESRRLPSDVVIGRIRRGDVQLVPIGINPLAQLIYFADLGNYRYHEWQHVYSIQQLAQSGLIKDYFSAPASLLDTPDLVLEARTPRGFILHISRCGSTLIGKALARAEGIGIVNQPSVLQHGFWSWIAANWATRDNWRPQDNPVNIIRFRNLVHLLCQPRVAGEKHVFIKFISWNSLYADFIHLAFPTTPMLYMYRNPVEVIASVVLETSAVMMARAHKQAEFLSGKSHKQLQKMDAVAYLSACYAHFFNTIVHAQSQPKMLNYTALKASALDHILSAAFDLQATTAQLGQMREQFLLYSKDDRNQTRFQEDSHKKRQILSDEQIQTTKMYCDDSWQQLVNSPQNIF